MTATAMLAMTAKAKVRGTDASISLIQGGILIKFFKKAYRNIYKAFWKDPSVLAPSVPKPASCLTALLDGMCMQSLAP